MHVVIVSDTGGVQTGSAQNCVSQAGASKGEEEEDSGASSPCWERGGSAGASEGKEEEDSGAART